MRGSAAGRIEFDQLTGFVRGLNRSYFSATPLVEQAILAQFPDRAVTLVHYGSDHPAVFILWVHNCARSRSH